MSIPFSLFDKRHYPTVDVAAGYAEWAHVYDARQGDELDIDLLKHVQSIQWKEINSAIDLACGTGRIGAWMKAQGVRQIHGVDLSPQMITHAARKNIYTSLAQANMVALPHPAAACGLGITVLATCHLPDLIPFFQEAGRVIKNTLIIVDYHPFFLIKGIPTHFDNANGEAVAIENTVHLISDYVNAAREAHWSLIEMRERLVDEKWIARAPGMGKYINEPVSFVMVWRRML